MNFSRKEKVILILLIFAAVFGGALFYWSSMPDNMPLGNNVPEKQADHLTQINAELADADHPLRKQIEEYLHNVKHNNVVLTALDEKGENVEVRWTQYRYICGVGYVFQSNETYQIQTEKTAGWRISEFPKINESQKVEDSTHIAQLQQWNGKQFAEIDESVLPVNREVKTVIYIHGLDGNTQCDWHNTFAQRIRKIEKNTNILAVDWKALQKQHSKGMMDWLKEKTENLTGQDLSAVPLDKIPSPIGAANAIPEVADQVNTYLFDKNHLALLPDKVYLTGFSHGAHVVGMIGMKHKVKRITILDASTRITHLDMPNWLGRGWDKTAAQFIDMYASSHWAGTSEMYGHKNFFIVEKGYRNDNWNKGLFNTVTDHLYAANWFLTTIGSQDKEFGYSMDEKNMKPVDGWAGLIESSLPRSGTLDNTAKPQDNKLIPIPK